MSIRKIISIDETKCTGCGLCIPNCPEGALKIIDGKARLVGEVLCDGLGACLGHCPEGAITIEEREAAPFSADAVHAQVNGPVIEDQSGHHNSHAHAGHACPGSRAMDVQAKPAPDSPAEVPAASELSNWPVQLHLISPAAPQFARKDLLLSADCVAYAAGAFHARWLKGKALAIACPKLDEGSDVYVEKLTALIDHARINTLTVMMMEVPCCQGLLAMAERARAQAHRKIPLKAVVLSIQGGEVLSEEWV